jgi:hypothetical protein
MSKKEWNKICIVEKTTTHQPNSFFIALIKKYIYISYLLTRQITLLKKDWIERIHPTQFIEDLCQYNFIIYKKGKELFLCFVSLKYCVIYLYSIYSQATFSKLIIGGRNQNDSPE